MNSVDDILFAPIFPSNAEDQLRELLRRIMTIPQSESFEDAMKIMDLFHKHGITNPKDILGIIDDVAKEIENE
jgi:hypothetical protein